MDKKTAMVLSSFCGDSLALGVHWIYDTETLNRQYGRVEQLIKPGENSYHKTKDKGEFTHYGDQALVLLESLADQKEFVLSDFSRRWRVLFSDYNGYIDHATSETLEIYAAGGTHDDKGAPSTDLAGASRIAPLIYLFSNDEDRLVSAAKAQTRMTHSDPMTMDSAEFFARVCCRTLNGLRPVEAIEQVTQERFGDSSISRWVEAGLNAKDKESVKSIAGFGQSCHTTEAFPGVIQLIARYERDLREALIQCAMAGGDSAARGMVVGMILGAHLGSESLPHEWLSGIGKGEYILSLLSGM